MSSSLGILFLGSLLALPAQGLAADAAEDLPPRYVDFLEGVAPLLLEEEKEIFLSLSKDYQRDAFITRFWKVRDPFPQTVRNELRERWEENLTVAREMLPDLEGPRARMLLFNGKPRMTLRSRCMRVLRPLEIWFYDTSPLIRGEFALVFLELGGNRYRLWSPTETVLSLTATAVPPGTLDRGLAEMVVQNCARGDEVWTGLRMAVDWTLVEEEIDVVTEPSPEWARTFLSYSTDLPEDAQLLDGAALSVDYPGRHQSRTVVQVLLSVEREEATLGRVGDRSSYNFLVDGEVLRRGELFEHFRYKFDVPRGRAGETELLPLVLQRYLRPGTYTLVLKLQDMHSERFFRTSREIRVPNLRSRRPRVADARAVPEIDVQSEPDGRLTMLSEANEAIADLSVGDQTLKLRAPRDHLKTGRIRVEAVTQGEGFDKVSFGLNGKRVMSKTRPPYSVELDLGHAPRVHTLEAIGYDRQGRVLAQDEILLNSGPHRFSVRLIEPQRGRRYRKSVRAHAEVQVPELETLDRVEFHLNETLIATLYQPPFVQPMLIPPEQELSYVRAVAFLDDGNSTEDVVFVNSPHPLDEITINMVELYTSVMDNKGRPAEGLAAEDFVVYEDGEKQEIRRFELVDDLPIHAGILLDTSTSMEEELEEAEEAAMHFFHAVLTPKDRACLITFNDEPQLVTRFTNNVEVLAGGLAGLVAERETALYDSLIFSLYYFSGLKGKRALIVLSDGEDVRSRYRYDEVIEFARRTGVAIYPIGLSVPTRDMDIRAKLTKLAQETGGQFFFIERARELKSVYSRIQKELRSQYLLAYQSSKEGDGYRRTEVEVLEPGLEAKTMRGYYP